MRSVFAIVLVSLYTMAGVSHAAVAKDGAVASWALGVLPDPGPKPSLDPREYDPYMKEGTSVITGRLTLPASFGRNLTCMGEDVLLYPSTPYTRWIIQTWARKLDGGTEEFGLMQPDDYKTGIKVPTYLRALADDPPRAIRFGHCDESNNLYIAHVPAGRYVLVTQVGRQVVGDIHHEYGQLMVQTPTGEYPADFVTKTTGGYRYDDGYVVTFNGELEVKPGQQYTISIDSIRAVAHYHPRKGQV